MEKLDPDTLDAVAEGIEKYRDVVVRMAYGSEVSAADMAEAVCRDILKKLHDEADKARAALKAG